MVERMKDIDEPAVENGDAVKRELVTALEQIRESFSKAIESARKLSTNDLQSFSAGVGTLSGEVQRNLGTAGDEFKRLSDETEELQEAIDGEPACQRFRT
jgi:hypothetical protein